jgi:BNR repeat-like domain
MSTIKHNDRMLRICLVSLAVLFIFTSCKKNYERNSQVLTGPNPPIRISSASSDAAEPAIATASDGAVYLAWVNHGPQNQADVMLARYTSDGQLQNSAVLVNTEPGAATAWRGDPPTVTVAPDNTVLVGWTARDKSESGHASTLFVSASRDRGKTFDRPIKVNDDSKPAVHGMHSLAVGQDGRIYVAWLDERNITPMPMNDMKMDPSKGGHHMESNRELFLAYSTDDGRTFSANQRIATDVCPCCKTALAIGPDGHVYVSWRQVLPGDFRHIAVAGSTDGGKTFSTPVIVSDDQWVLKGCPVSGAGLSVDGAGKLRVLWYAGAENTQPGIYWSESQDGGRSFSPRKLLAPGFARSTPVLVSDGPNNPFAIWESSGTNGSEVRATSFGALTEPNQLLITQNGELPAAIVQNKHVFVTYVAKEGEKRNVWLLSASL